MRRNTCKQCQVMFISRRFGGVYCSTKCRMRAHRKLIREKARYAELLPQVRADRVNGYANVSDPAKRNSNSPTPRAPAPIAAVSGRPYVSSKREKSRRPAKGGDR